MIDIINMLLRDGGIAWSGPLDTVVRAILREARNRGWRMQVYDSTLAVWAIQSHRALSMYRTWHGWRVIRRP